jgi:GMP synthase PP-ATPase subunit
LDGDPAIDYNRNAFARVFKAFLNQTTEIELNASNKNLTYFTELEYINKTELPKKSDIQNNYARVGDLVFNKAHKTWKLVFAYLTDDTIESFRK